MVMKYDVAIIGGGIVGLSAAIYCKRLNLKTVLLAKNYRGTIANAGDIENYPGFKKISGMELATRVLDHAKEYKPEMVEREVINIEWNKNSCFKVFTKKNHYHAKNILFATGAKSRKLNVKGEALFMNKGVHTCALCDGPFYKNKIIAVVGGGDSAAKEALLLSNYAKKVYMIIRSTLKADPVNRDRIKANKKIQIIEGIQIKEIKGDKFVNSVVLDKKISNSNILKLDGIFVEIGHLPLSELAKKLGVKTNKQGEIIIDKNSKTNKAGIFAAGDVADTRFNQAITGVGEAVKAAYGIYEKLTGEEIICG